MVVIAGTEFLIGSPPGERAFSYEWFTVRSAHRGDTTYFPNQTRDNVGVRVARTMP